MSDQTVRFVGRLTPDALAEHLRAHPFAEQREAMMTRITLIALRNSMQRTPVRTGTLRRSETTRVEPGGLKGFVGTNVFYAPFVHDGTPRRAARPFFAQGIADSRDAIVQILGESGDEYFKKAVP